MKFLKIVEIKVNTKKISTYIFNTYKNNILNYPILNYFVEICKSKEGLIGIKTPDGKVITLANNSVIEIALERCVNVDVKIEDKKAIFKGLEIPLLFTDEKLNYLRLLYVLKGETSHEIFYFKNVEIHVDTKLREVKIESNVRFTRFCGNYGLLFPQYCIGNETFAIFGKKKEDVIEAFNAFMQLLNVIRKVLLELS